MSEPAFPQTDPNGNQWWGLTKREIFAALALQGWLSSWPQSGGIPRYDILAQTSVDAADALISELAKREQR